MRHSVLRSDSQPRAGVFTLVDTPVGPVALVKTSAGLCRVMFAPRDARRAVPAVVRECPGAVRDNRACRVEARALKRYFRGEREPFDLPLDLDDVTPFRRRVYAALRAHAPYGRTITYAELADACGSPCAARAVGAAMAHNPLPLVVPCHRVTRSDGALGGFSAPDGVELKKRLLRLEARRRE
ncbi:MAG: methylated-DNA--[protein]-cysteine S-methyltransferase [Planctomycetes bacterium]|nr:methylated-DNA--[protein]-cysteine S-methyltransferase [Planctomycetota bacterium]